MSAMMNGVQLATDRSWRPEPFVLDMDLGDVVPVAAVSPRTKLGYEIEWPEKSSFVTLRVKIAAPDGPAGFSMNLPVDGFDFNLREGELNDPARRMLERWIHRFVKLKLAGASFADIAQVLELPSPATARHIFETAIAASGDDEIDYKTLRTIANARLEGLLKGVFPRAIDTNDSEQLAFQRQALSVIDRGIKLNGLDAPSRVEVYSPTSEEFVRVIEQAASALGGTTHEADIFSDVFELEQAPDGETWRKEDDDE